MTQDTKITLVVADVVPVSLHHQEKAAPAISTYDHTEGLSVYLIPDQDIDLHG